MRPVFIACTIALALTLAPTATAGTADAPELTDPEGDCAIAPGNEYMDIVAAWVSDETAADFKVNLALAKWTDVASHAAAFTVQFTHQGKQWGVIGFYDAAEGWYFATGLVTQEGQTEGFNETDGTFTPGTPAVMSITFPKDLFPHTQAMDHVVTDFWAGSVDIKPYYAQFFTAGAGAPWIPVPPFGCDEATGDATYTFQTGDHAMGDMEGMDHGSGNESTTGDVGDATTHAGTAEPADAADADGATTDTPAPGALAALVVALATALAGRAARRRG